MKVLYVLSQSELCVSDIAELLCVISHQLRIFKHSKLVKGRREGNTVLLSLEDNHVTMILNQGLEHTIE